MEKSEIRKKSAKAKESSELIKDIQEMIEEARGSIASLVNAALTTLYWRIGNRINQEILCGDRAEYGKQILATLSQELTRNYGSGFGYSALTRMTKLAQAFPNKEIVATLSQNLSWSHFIEILPLEKPIQREFYVEMCRLERWSVRTLRQKIDSMLYERTAISRKPEEVVKAEISKLREEDKMTPDIVFRDPYFLDFLGLRDHYVEKDIEDAILRELERFLLELGTGFTFVARQKRITVDHDDYYLDLLLFHRGLRRLVAIDLKLGDFKPADKGQMELYLRWLQKYEKHPTEDTPIGLILCAGKKQETVELLELEKSSIRVAEYLIELPPKELLEKKLHSAIQQARALLEMKKTDSKK